MGLNTILQHYSNYFIAHILISFKIFSCNTICTKSTKHTDVSLDIWYYRELSKYKYTTIHTYRFFTTTLITQLYVQDDIRLAWDKYLSKRGDVGPQTNLILPLEVPVQTQENERSCLCVLGVSIWHLFLRFWELF